MRQIAVHHSLLTLRVGVAGLRATQPTAKRRSQSPTHIESRFMQLGHLQKNSRRRVILRERPCARDGIITVPETTNPVEAHGMDDANTPENSGKKTEP